MAYGTAIASPIFSVLIYSRLQESDTLMTQQQGMRGCSRTLYLSHTDAHKRSKTQKEHDQQAKPSTPCHCAAVYMLVDHVSRYS